VEGAGQRLFGGPAKIEIDLFAGLIVEDERQRGGVPMGPGLQSRQHGGERSGGDETVGRENSVSSFLFHESILPG
jgi:hypothetical protein